MFKLTVICLIVSWVQFGSNAQPQFKPLIDDCLKLYKDAQSYGGLPQNGVNEQEKCWIQCQKTTDCKAFEWLPYNRPDFKCFLFTNSQPPSTPERSDVYHYVVLCECKWKEFQKSRSFGGKSQVYNTLETCQGACLEDKKCKAVEWKTSLPSPQCFFFESTSVPIHSTNDINHYIWNCKANSIVSQTTSFLPGLPTTSAPGCFWFFKRNYRSSKTINKIAYTLMECKKACLEYNNCQNGLEWKGANASPMERCAISDDSDINGYPGNDHYMYNCSNSILNVWKVDVNQNTRHANLETSVYSLDECKEFCVSLTSCQNGFDWNKKAPLGQGCWISKNSELFPTIVKGEVDHYSLKLISVPLPIDIKNCTWTKMQNKNSPGGMPKPQFNTFDKCQAYCIKANRADCIGIDWNSESDTKCWFSVKKEQTNFNGVNHYVLECFEETTSTLKPITGSTTTTESTNKAGCGYQKYPNSSSSNGVLKNYSSDRDCRDQCTVQQSCKAYEWRENEPDGEQCLFYKTSDEPEKNNVTPGRTYYLYKICG